MRLSALDYVLPEGRIANEPARPRESARLLVVDEPFRDARVSDLPDLLPPCLLVANDTRVLPARAFGQRPSGGKVEILFVEPLPDGSWSALTRSSRALRDGDVVRVAGGSLRVRGRAADGSVTLEPDLDVLGFLEAHGELPLPPYIDRPVAAVDTHDYQTTFAREPGAVAAPTAGLHFTPSLLAALRERGIEQVSVTLHVGPGTFRPVKVDDLDEHPMHEERYHVSRETALAITSARNRGIPVVAIGTTVVRTLESAAEAGRGVREGAGRTRLLIQPGHRFEVVDGLVTNFHLPRSTLLALVMAFAGVERTRAAYAHALAGEYRFFSYGDAMLIPPASRA